MPSEYYGNACFRILDEKMTFSNRQFGFKRGTSTTDACFLLKEVINNYTKDRAKVYTAFIDLSKAFDKVDHFILGNTLLRRGIPANLVSFIMHYL